MLDLVGLLERRSVDPSDERLGGAADGALADGVPAPLVPVVAVRIVLVDLGRGHGSGRARRGQERAPAARERAATAVLARVLPAHLLAEHGAQVLAHEAVPG